MGLRWGFIRGLRRLGCYTPDPITWLRCGSATEQRRTAGGIYSLRRGNVAQGRTSSGHDDSKGVWGLRPQPPEARKLPLKPQNLLHPIPARLLPNQPNRPPHGAARKNGPVFGEVGE